MKQNNTPDKYQEQGSIIVSILIVTSFLITIVFGLIVLATSNLARARSRLLLLQAQYAAESGADSAIAELNNGNVSYGGTSGEVEILNNSIYRSTYSATVINSGNTKERLIKATGKVYSPKSAAQATQIRNIEVLAQRSATTTSSSMISRNIIDIESGVKNVIARDVYANGYIRMNKNTTNLIAENITVVDKNTGASNCSIGGTGNLLKPGSFTNPGQTKTKITLGYNNCISPPGNISNADFDVLPNQTNLSKIQSTLIPWSEYMDSTYQNSPGGCSDWTSGTFPRDIPSTGNTKKTHYPDSDSTISLSCGSSGNLMLDAGQYNIRDHVHLRANLCGSTGCDVTFNNPDGAIKFVFIEGTIYFDSIQTAAGSGPIVLVSYGSDPGALSSVCPTGGSVFMSNDGTSSAPKVYLLASNGLCMDKTKFGADPALGGISGKNLYISTNPGTPFDLRLDPTFPVDQIPVDLAWRAVRYQRR